MLIQVQVDFVFFLDLLEMLVEEIHESRAIVIWVLTRGVLAISDMDQLVVFHLKSFECVKLLQVIDDRKGDLQSLIWQDKGSPLDVLDLDWAPGVRVIVVRKEVLARDDSRATLTIVRIVLLRMGL